MFCLVCFVWLVGFGRFGFGRFGFGRFSFVGFVWFVWLSRLCLVFLVGLNW